MIFATLAALGFALAPSGCPDQAAADLNRWLAGYAAGSGHVYLDYFSRMADVQGLLRPELNDDGLHPNARGYAAMTPLAEAAIAVALKAR